MLTSAIERRYLTLVLVDALVVVVSLFVAWSGRAITAELILAHALAFSVVAALVYCYINNRYGLYRRIWRYAAPSEVGVIARSAALSTLLLLVGDLVWPGRRPVPISVVPFMGFFSLVGFVGVRYRRRMWTDLSRARALPNEPVGARTRVLIYGAGEAGQLLAWRMLTREEGQAYELVGFVDDDAAKIGMLVHGLPVLGGRQALPGLVSRHAVDTIIVAIYSLDARSRREILAGCERTTARIKVLPNPFDFVNATNGLGHIRDVTSEDLLGRKAVTADAHACSELLRGKSVLVTGAAGSIGSELCRQVATFRPQRLLMVDNNESSLHDLALDLEAGSGPGCIRLIVGDVTDGSKMQAIFAGERPDIVFHAAAYKHVPLMEEFPDEAVRVNILGTRTVLELACRYQAGRFVFISSDKAVRPTSVMGASKRVGELLVLTPAGGSRTLAAAVRFGNVLGSRGSVIPIFERQIDAGGPVTITHPQMTRYFMTINEAVSLVIQAGAATEGGDLFVLDMGEQVPIEQLACRLIRLRGLRPGVDIALKYTGIRPGEKLHEQLAVDGDVLVPTGHPTISRLDGGQRVDRGLLLGQIDELVRLAREQKVAELTAKLFSLVGQEEALAVPPVSMRGSTATKDTRSLTAVAGRRRAHARPGR